VTLWAAMWFGLLIVVKWRSLFTVSACNSLPPIVIRKSGALSARRKPSRFGLLSVAAWMSLLGFSAAQPPQAAEIAGCTVAQKKPLYVGFAKDMGLDDFESTAAASVDIVREVKHWACGNAERANIAVPSLQLALARGGVRLEQVQFKDASHAFVLLRTETHPRWRVDLAEADDVWRVTHNRVTKPSDDLDLQAHDANR
jgi:hypothetical protein